jgi:rhamnose utilization protein RhaD (predicted bifunctional aldolase and dehydrogenase)
MHPPESERHTAVRRTRHEVHVSSGTLTELVELSKALGNPGRDLVVLGEGNTSTLVDGERFVVKASGTSLAGAAPESFVELRLQATLGLLALDSPTDAELLEGLMAARTDEGPRPSIEAVMHALSLTEGGARFVGHTHPTAVNAILCSNRAEALVAGAIFPDQVVVCGREALLVAYADPGLPLAHALREGLREYRGRTGTTPKTVYLRNHGMLALGQSAAEVDQITTMATKAARILAGALSLGEPVYLSATHADRIEARPDEHHRRRMLRDRGGTAIES